MKNERSRPVPFLPQFLVRFCSVLRRFVRYGVCYMQHGCCKIWITTQAPFLQGTRIEFSAFIPKPYVTLFKSFAESAPVRIYCSL